MLSDKIAQNIHRLLAMSKPKDSVIRPKKRNCSFPVRVQKKNRVGRSVKIFFFALFFWSKMCVLCMFYDDWEL